MVGVEPDGEGVGGVADLPVRACILEPILGERVAIEQDFDVRGDLLRLRRLARAATGLEQRVEGLAGALLPHAVGGPDELFQLVEHELGGVLDHDPSALAGALEQGLAAFRIVQEEVLAVADHGVVHLEALDQLLLRLDAAHVAPDPVLDLVRQLSRPLVGGDDDLALGGEPRDVARQGIEVGVGLVLHTPHLGAPFRGELLARADGLDHLRAGGDAGPALEDLAVDTRGAEDEDGADAQCEEDVDEPAHLDAPSRGGGIGGPRGWLPAKV